MYFLTAFSDLWSREFLVFYDIHLVLVFDAGHYWHICMELGPA